LNDGAEEALQRARAHLHQATLEGLEAARALLEVGLHTSGLADASGDSLLENLQHSLESLITGIRENASFVLPRALAEPLAAALESEIKRWEHRSQTDPDARPVLRAFLGLRELLWELGLGRDAKPSDSARAGPRRNDDAASPRSPTRERVQHFDIED
jgi:hypothetical protein